MRLLVDARTLEGAPRMRLAAWGLALRGHAVAWLGPTPVDGDPAPQSVQLVRRARDARPVDVTIGAADRLTRVAWSAWNAGASVAVLDAGDGGTPWSFERRAIAETLGAGGLYAPAAGSAAAPAPVALAAARWRPWPESEPPAAPDATHPDTEALERTAERTLAAHRGPRPGVFLDRDGTLVVEVGYLAHAEDLQLLPGVAEALRSLQSAGFALVVVSNQSGVGRGLFPLSRVYEAMGRLRALLRREGVELDAVHFCPHRPDAGCSCRKPSPELLRRAAADLGLVLAESVMIGDKLLDVETGRTAGARAALVRTGYGRDEERRLPEPGPRTTVTVVVDDLRAAAGWILERRNR